MSKWSDTIKYINGFPPAHHFTPKDIKNHVIGSEQSTGIYVNYLHKAGFLFRISLGVYIRIHNIPTDLTLTKLKSFAYPEGKGWEERKEMVERYWKLKTLKDKIK